MSMDITNKLKISYNYTGFIRIFLLSFTGFILNFTMNFSTILTYSLYLKKIGSEYMSFHYMAYIFLSIIGYILYVKNISGIKWLNLLTVFMGLIYLSFPVSVTWNEAIIVFIMFMLTKLYFIYGIVFYFGFVNNVLTVREMKKYIGWISGLGFSGAILAGAITKPLLLIYSMNYCFILTGIICLITVLPVILTKKFCLKKDIKEKKEPAPLKETLGINFVKLMIVFVIISGIIRYFLDFQFSDVMSAKFSNDKELASFYGFFNALSTSLILISQIFFTGKILKFISLSTSFKIISIIFISFSLLSLIYPSFWIIVSFQFLFMLLLRIMIEPAKRILVGAVSTDIREGVRFAAEGVFYCIGVSLTGLIIALLNILSPGPEVFFSILLFLSFIYLLFTAGLDKAYVEALIGNLKIKPKKSREEIFDNLYNYNPHAGMNIFSRLLSITEGEIKLEVLRGLSLLGTKEAKEKLLKALNEETESHILCSIIKLMSNLEKDEKIYNRLSIILENTEDPLIISGIIEVLAQWGDNKCLETIYPFIFKRDHEVKGTAILAVLKLSSIAEFIETALQELINMLKDKEWEMRGSGLAVLGELRLECFIPTISAFFTDNHIKVRKNAAGAALKLRAPSLLEGLSEMLLKEENKEIYPLIENAISGTEDGTFEEMESIITGLPFKDKQIVIDSLRKIEGHIPLKLFIKSFSVEPHPLSIKLVELIGQHIHNEKIMTLFNSCFSEGKFILNPFIYEIISNKNFKDKYSLILKDLAEAGAKEIIAAGLIEIINNKKEFKTDRDFTEACFYITGIYWIGSETALQAFEDIHSKDSHKADVAVEIIENAIDNRELKKAILSLLPGKN